MERVQKLEQRISDVEQEIDKLVKLSPKDLWNIDLDEFIEAYRKEMEEDAQLARDNKKKARRISKGGKANKKTSKKRAADDSEADADFAVVKAKKKATIQQVEPKRNGLFDFFSKQSPPSKPAGKYVLENGREQSRSISIQTDGADDIKMEEDVAPAARGGRAVARKPVKYAVSDDDSDGSGNDMLGDVTSMVKGIGGGDSGRSLFRKSISRPTSSGNAPTAYSKATSRSNGKPSIIEIEEDDDGIDDTDYAKLVPQDSPQKPAARAAKDIKLSEDEEDNEDSLDVLAPAPAPAKKTTKPAPKKAAPAPKPKKAPAQKATTKAASVEPSQPKPVQLSPAAKAYAKKLVSKPNGKPAARTTKKVVLEDSDDDVHDDPNDLANDLLDDDDDDDVEIAAPPAKAKVPEPEPAGRSRRAAAVPKKYNFAMSDESEDEDEESEADFDDDSE